MVTINQTGAWIQEYALWLRDVGCIIVEDHKIDSHTIRLELRSDENLEPLWRVHHLYQNRTVFEDGYTHLSTALLHYTQIKGCL